MNNGQKQKHRGKRNERKERIIPIPKTGGFLSFLLPLLGALESMGGGSAGIAKAVNDEKTNRNLLEEQKRHNLIIESFNGKGLYLRPYKGYIMISKNWG